MMLSGMLIGLALAILAVRREAAVASLEKMVAEGRYRYALANADCSAGCGTRIELALVRATTRLAARSASASRDRLEAEAIRRSSALAAARPNSPAASVEFAYALSLDPARVAQARTALARSYALAPLLRDEAPWRISQAALNWGFLDARTRAAALAEADWYARLDGAGTVAVSAAMGDSPMTVAFLLRQRSR